MKSKKTLLLFISLLFSSAQIEAQPISQTVRGTVVDKISQTPIPGAVIQLLNAAPPVATTTDEHGKFKLGNVPVGKQGLKISYLGYKENTMQNLTVNSGKELVLTVSLEEDITQMTEVVVSTKMEKNKALNEMSAVSTRAFSVEETQKFAAAVNDPARMATSFAGVIQTSDGNNNISIRGNSPNGLLWRMEGVEIPNPNHFSNVGTSGGGISILSAQLMTNSDFSTGAFAAEYGNALSGVFDLKLRKGNNEKREYTLQAGILGLDVSTEGPFRKGKDGSYVINYRYSTLDILSKIGVPIFGDASTTYQDLTFNLSMPTKKAGVFGLFGFGGLSSQTLKAKKDSMKWKTDDLTQMNEKFLANTGAVGLTHTLLFKNQSYLKTALVLSGTQNGFVEGKLNKDYVNEQQYQQTFDQNKATLSSTYTKKINARSSLRTGFIFNLLSYNLNMKDKPDSSIDLVEKIDVKGSTQSAQAFIQWNQKLTQKLTGNIGLHYYQLLLNNSNSLEPRASLKYDVSVKHSLSLGYGLHSQLQPIGVYFARETFSDGSYNQPNKNLGLSKAHHVVAGYDWNINSFSHIKTEVYYQHLFNIPVSLDKTNTYSMLNITDGYDIEKLGNTGKGKNYGVELTYERFLYKNLYYLLSASVYDSKYQASNGNWYNTRFNTNYAGSFTIGKEWTLSEKRKNRVIGVNLKTILVGGRRFSTIDMDASIAAGETKYVDDKVFNEKDPDYFRLDTRISLKRNYRRVTTTLALDIQNTTNRANIGGRYFDSKTQSIKYWYQASLIPILSYRVEF
jgi:hypothetical protein